MQDESTLSLNLALSSTRRAPSPGGRPVIAMAMVSQLSPSLAAFSEPADNHITLTRQDLAFDQYWMADFSSYGRYLTSTDCRLPSRRRVL